MTHLTSNTASLTNTPTATSVSPLEQSGSNKDKFLTSFTSGKLRKNAKKKIAQLLDYADSLILKTQSMGLDDCWNANDPQTFDKSKFWEWYEKNYSDMIIYVSVSEGRVTRVKFCDCIYHFSNDIVMNFDAPAEEKEEIEPIQSAPINTRQAVSLGDYEQRVDHKRERLEERALKAHAEADSRYKASHDRASSIPFGQPILVGHHSEKRARRDAERIWSDMGKSVAATKKAERLESRAQSVGSAGIASDDPEAIAKLKTKLASLERSQEVMKAANKAIRSTKDEAEQLDKLVNVCGLTEKQAREILTPDHCGRVGFASYALHNNNANIRTTKKRLEELEIVHNQAPLSESW